MAARKRLKFALNHLFGLGLHVSLKKRKEMRKVYQVRCEKNDQGFKGGYYLYEKVADARQSMRDHIARQIRYARYGGKKVIKVFHFASDVMEEPDAKCEEIFLIIGEDSFDFRIWALELRDMPIEKKS